MNQYPLPVFLLLCLLLSSCTPEVNRPRDAHGLFALHQAADDGDIAAMQALFAQGAEPNVTDLDGVAPLHRAARDGKTEVVKLLLEHRADPNLKTGAGWTALQLALWKGHDATVETLLGFGALPIGTTPEGYTVLHLAAMSGTAYGMDLLFRDWKQSAASGRPDPNAVDKSGKTALDWALERNHDDAAATLLLRGADATKVDKNGNTLLHRLAGTGKVGLAGTIRAAGVPVNAYNHEGKTAYDLAMLKGDAIMAEWLAEAMGVAP